MARLPIVKGKDALRALLKAGFYVHHQTGSHARLFHRDRSDLHVTILIHNKDLPERTLKYILRQAQLDDEAFIRLLRE